MDFKETPEKIADMDKTLKTIGQSAEEISSKAEVREKAGRDPLEAAWQAILEIMLLSVEKHTVERPEQLSAMHIENQEEWEFYLDIKEKLDLLPETAAPAVSMRLVCACKKQYQKQNLGLSLHINNVPFDLHSQSNLKNLLQSFLSSLVRPTSLAYMRAVSNSSLVIFLPNCGYSKALPHGRYWSMIFVYVLFESFERKVSIAFVSSRQSGITR